MTEITPYGVYKRVGGSGGDSGGFSGVLLSGEDVKNALIDIANVIRLKNLDIEVNNQVPEPLIIPAPLVTVSPTPVTILPPAIQIPKAPEPIVVIKGASSRSVLISAGIIATAIICDLVARILHLG